MASWSPPREGRAVAFGLLSLIVLAVFLVVAVMAVLTAPLNITIFVIGLLLIAVLVQPERMILVVCLTAPYLGLVRRLAAVQNGRVEADALALLPIVGLILACVVAWSRRGEKVRSILPSRIAVLAALTGLAVIGLTRRLDIDSIYSFVVTLLPLAVAPLVISGRLKDVWPTFARIYPLALVPAAAYGVAQYYLLPSWDRDWMVASGMSSVGAPFPMQVRVFGTAESPGPFALFLAVAVVIAIANAVTAKQGIVALLWTALAGAFLYPFLLTAVRSALLALLAAAALLAIARGRGVGRFLPVLPIAAVFVILPRILDASSGVSSVLVADRYTNFDAGSDPSLQHRLGLIEFLINPVRYFLGGSPGRYDNLVVDAIANFGYVFGLLIAVAYVWYLVVATRLLFRRAVASAGAVVVFVSFVSVAGNPFLSSFSVLCCVAYASVAKAYIAIPRPELPQRKARSARARISATVAGTPTG